MPCPYIPDSGHSASGVRDFDVGASSQPAAGLGKTAAEPCATQTALTNPYCTSRREKSLVRRSVKMRDLPQPPTSRLIALGRAAERIQPLQPGEHQLAVRFVLEFFVVS